MDLPLGLVLGGHAVELHDDAVLGRIVGDRVADGGGDGFAGRLAGHGRVGGRDERAGLDLGEVDHRNLGRQDARDLDEVDVADAGCQQRVVEGIEGGAAFRVTRGCRRHRHLLRHSPLLTLEISPPITVPPPGRREIFGHFTEPSNERKRKVTPTTLLHARPPPELALAMPATPFRSCASISRRLADAERRSLDAAVDRPTPAACFRSPAARFQPAGATPSSRGRDSERPQRDSERPRRDSRTAAARLRTAAPRLGAVTA